MTKHQPRLYDIFELEEIVKAFLKESKNNPNTPFQIDFKVSYRPSVGKHEVVETMSVFLTKTVDGGLSVAIAKDSGKTGHTNNTTLNEKLSLQTVFWEKWGANPNFKTRCFIGNSIIDWGLLNHESIKHSASFMLERIKSVGFVELEPTVKEVA